jgi:hypothetical protein
MNHLSPTEIVDLAEGTLGAARSAHADGCERCRDAAADLRRVLATATGVDRPDVPEPSPLFWDHLSARVRVAVAQEPAPRREWMAWRPAFAALAGVLLFVTALGSLMLRHTVVRDAGATNRGVAPAAETAAAEAPYDMTVDSNTEVWDVLAAAAADLEIDAAREAGLTVQPPTIEGSDRR